MPSGAAGYEPTDDDTEEDVIELGRLQSKEKEKPHKRSRFSLHHAPSKEFAVPKPTYEVTSTASILNFFLSFEVQRLRELG